MNTYQTVTRQSWGSKIKSALAGIILGPLLILGSCVLLWYNENRSFERTQDINYAEKELISLPDTHFSPENNEKFIHMTGPIAGKSISDPLINLTLSGILLSREVEMYQWKESSSSQSQDELGGSTTTTTQYSYTKEWSTTLISSDNFAQANGHTNPKSFPYSAEKFLDTEARLGDFTFSSELLNILPRGKEIPLSEVHTSLLSGSTLLGNTLYLSQNPTNPQIGDIRFTYTGIENGDVLSVLAMQNADSSLSKFPAKHGTVESIAWGKASGGEMIESLRTQNTFLTWGLRIL